jgi:hypothetical protein
VRTDPVAGHRGVIDVKVMAVTFGLGHGSGFQLGLGVAVKVFAGVQGVPEVAPRGREVLLDPIAETGNDRILTETSQERSLTPELLGCLCRELRPDARRESLTSGDPSFLHAGLVAVQDGSSSCSGWIVGAGRDILNSARTESVC